MAMTRRDAVNDAYERLSGLGFTMAPGFAMHGPMVAETLSTLGRNDAVAPWVEHYKAKRRHLPPPPPQAPIDEAGWQGALGDAVRTADWLAFFRRTLAAEPWQGVLATWVPRLLDGHAGGLTHGLIRTAHAVRAIPAGETPTALERDELAHGLAYWAATYRRAAGDPDAHGDLDVAAALRALPREAPQAPRPGPPRNPAAGDELPGLAEAVERLAAADDADAAISRHSAAMARLLLAHAELRPIPLIQLIHSITAPVAARNLLPFLSPRRDAWIYACLWRVSAAIVARMAPLLAQGSELEPKIEAPALTEEELVARAVEHRDDHAIKLTEALLREDRRRPDPAYRAAAEAVLDRLPRWT